MNDHQSPDGTKALLAAMSALGLALGVTPAKADPPANNPWGSASDQNKETSNQAKMKSQKIDWGSNQQKSDQYKSSQFKSNQLKGNQYKANQLKSSQFKSNQLKSNQIKMNDRPTGQTSTPN